MQTTRFKCVWMDREGQREGRARTKPWPTKRRFDHFVSVFGGKKILQHKDTWGIGEGLENDGMSGQGGRDPRHGHAMADLEGWPYKMPVGGDGKEELLVV